MEETEATRVQLAFHICSSHVQLFNKPLKPTDLKQPSFILFMESSVLSRAQKGQLLISASTWHSLRGSQARVTNSWGPDSSHTGLLTYLVFEICYWLEPWLELSVATATCDFSVAAWCSYAAQRQNSRGEWLKRKGGCKCMAFL